jgi:cofilin
LCARAAPSAAYPPHAHAARRTAHRLASHAQATYAEFTKLLPEAECRYAVYDFSYVGKEGVEKNKLFFISWVPDVAKVKAKMLYASSKERFRRDLDGVQLEIQATDASEIEESVLRDKCTQVGQ